MTTITAPKSTPRIRRGALVRAPQVAAWAVLTGLAAAVRVIGYVTLVIAMGVEAGARGVLDRKER